jgi:hypothetical protein
MEVTMPTWRKLLVLCGLLLLLAAAVTAQQKPRVFVGEIKGPEEFIGERFKLLFMEELSRTKSIELVTRRD